MLQSLPVSRLADRVLKYAPSEGGKSKGEGSVLGGLGNILMGDNYGRLGRCSRQHEPPAVLLNCPRI